MAGWGAGNSRVTKPRRSTLFSAAAARLTANQIRKILNYGYVITENKKRNLEHRAGNLRSLNTYMKHVYYPRQERMRNEKKKRRLVRKYGERWLKKVRAKKQ